MRGAEEGDGEMARGCLQPEPWPVSARIYCNCSRQQLAHSVTTPHVRFQTTTDDVGSTEPASAQLLGASAPRLNQLRDRLKRT
jgi:hypothetical protein